MPYLLLWAPAATRHRLPPGVSSARPFGTGRAAPPAVWCKRRRRAFGPPASMLACRMPIRRLFVGRSAPAAVCSGSFLPPKLCGGQKWPVCFERKRLRRASVYPPPPPEGVRGEKERRASRGFRVMPHGWVVPRFPAPGQTVPLPYAAASPLAASPARLRSDTT